MRIKTLVLSAMFGASAIVTSSAQNVYSVNVVGYINLTLSNQWSIVANQLDDGKGNQITNLFAAAPATYPVTIYKYNGSGYDRLIREGADEWSFVPDTLAVAQATLKPGEAVFYKKPVGQPDHNVTFVGEVMQGTLDNTLKNGLNLVSTMVPQAGGLTTVHNYQPTNLDKVAYGFNGVSYQKSTFEGVDGWTDGEPVVGVAEGFFVTSRAAGDVTWTREFNVE